MITSERPNLNSLILGRRRLRIETLSTEAVVTEPSWNNMNSSIWVSAVILFLGWLTTGDSIRAADPSDPLALNFHLMHPGGDSKPGDPNSCESGYEAMGT